MRKAEPGRGASPSRAPRPPSLPKAALETLTLPKAVTWAAPAPANAEVFFPDMGAKQRLVQSAPSSGMWLRPTSSPTGLARAPCDVRATRQAAASPPVLCKEPRAERGAGSQQPRFRVSALPHSLGGPECRTPSLSKSVDAFPR